MGDATRQVTDDAYIRGDVTPLSAQVDGYVRHVAVDDFQRVEKGDLLVEIDDADYKAQVAQAEAALLGAEAAIANIKSRKATQKAQVAEAEAAIIATNADVERTKDEAERQRELLATTFGTAQKVEQAIAAEKRSAATLVRDQAALDAERRSSRCSTPRNPNCAPTTRPRRQRSSWRRSTSATPASRRRSRARSANAACATGSTCMPGPR